VSWVEASLSDRFLERVRQQPAAPALVWDGRRISYRELHAIACGAASRLETPELADQRPVGIKAKKSPQAIALILACLMVRRPVLLASADLGTETLRQLWAQAGISHVLTPEVGAPGGFTVATGDVPAREDGVGARPAARCDDVAVMLTTSGSTGVPKIVPLTHRAVRRFTDWASERFEITAGTTVLNYAPLHFDLCLLDIWTTLEHGGCATLVDQDRATDPGYLIGLIADAEVHVVQAVPMLYQLLLHGAPDGGRPLESVVHAVVTGDSMPAGCLDALFGLLPRARLYNLYGATETNDSFIHEIDPSHDRAPIPIGRPLPGVHALILSADGRVLEGAGTGELLVSTPFQTEGYLSEALNEGKLVVRSDDPDRRTYFRTGDIVRRDGDGVITLEGRADSFVKVRGVRVSTQAVERVIATHPQVVEAAVAPFSDELSGHRLHAVVRRAADSDLHSLSLRRHCARFMDRVAIPSTVEIVTTPLPKTSTGKVDRRRALPQSRAYPSG